MDRHQLSEEEIDMIVDKLCDRLTDKVYRNVGQGIMSIVWKGVVLIIVALAAYGAGVHWFK